MLVIKYQLSVSKNRQRVVYMNLETVEWLSMSFTVDAELL